MTELIWALLGAAAVPGVLVIAIYLIVTDWLKGN